MLWRTRSSNGSIHSAPSNGEDDALLVDSVMAWAPCNGWPAVALMVVSHQELTPPCPIPTNPAPRPVSSSGLSASGRLFPVYQPRDGRRRLGQRCPDAAPPRAVAVPHRPRTSRPPSKADPCPHFRVAVKILL